MSDDWKQGCVDAVEWIATYDGQEMRDSIVSGMMERLKSGISDRQQGLHIQGSEGEDLYLYNDDLDNK